ncbi:hypothetical protein FISHEDRAFT_55263 [Fistulina hepatica ATCC 64428]|uniref:Uncharacterized protein n=1 Tax=Fistulina hepatica ATCC 64428 TaxID=1128425 RepID=A0A0D7AN90_9AGAR|nr:hypothetical protein FISHEDRAFT_55263 [Fistulina hepatica ATCC 64428]
MAFITNPAINVLRRLRDEYADSTTKGLIYLADPSAFESLWWEGSEDVGFTLMTNSPPPTTSDDRLNASRSQTEGSTDTADIEDQLKHTPSPSNASTNTERQDTHPTVTAAPPAYDDNDKASHDAALQLEHHAVPKSEESTDATSPTASTSDDSGIPAILAIVGTIVCDDFLMCFLSSIFEFVKTKFKFTLRQPDMFIKGSKLLSPEDIDLISSFQRDWPVILEHLKLLEQQAHTSPRAIQSVLKRPATSRVELRYKPFLKYGDFDNACMVYDRLQPKTPETSVDPCYIPGQIQPDGMGFEKFFPMGESVTADELNFSSSTLDDIPLFMPHATWCLPGDSRTRNQLDSTTGHVIRPPPAFDLAGDFIPLHRLYDLLIGSTVEVRFELLHFKISEGNGKFRNTFTTNIVSIYMLAPKSPDFDMDNQGGPSAPTSP